MDDAWEELQAAGVPDGAPRPAPRGPLDAARLRRAFATATSGPPLPERRRETLHAWLAAFRHHWPARFSAVLGDDGDRALARLAATPGDPNRYLKLRRIALENLAHLL